METLNILIMCASVFWIIVFFLCLGPCLLSASKVATQRKEYTGKFQNRTQSAEYFKCLNHKRYSAPSEIVALSMRGYLRQKSIFPSSLCQKISKPKSVTVALSASSLHSGIRQRNRSGSNPKINLF